MKKYTYHKFIILVFLSVFICSIFLFSCSREDNSTPTQLTEGSGQYVARIHFKDYGNIDLRLFENYSPTAVSEFIRLANEGYYNNKSVYNVINDFCVLVGNEAVEASQNNASSNTTKEFNDEICDELYPLTGSLCIFNEGYGINAEHFSIITADTDFLSKLSELLGYKKITPQEYYKAAYGTDLDADTLAVFDTYGGAPWLYRHCIVFGQIYDGFDVISKIGNLQTEGDSYSPLNEVIIESIEIK